MKIVVTKKFKKHFKTQPSKIQRKFKERIDLFFIDIHHPKLYTHKLSGQLQNLWSFNVSDDVRVIFDTDQDDVILLIDIGTHNKLYS